jgi:hypothetical protein
MHFYKKSSSLFIAIVFNSNLFAQLCTPNPDLPQPTMTCFNSPFICDLQNYCSVLPNTDEYPDGPASGCPQFSALNNPAYFSFIATDNTVSITLIYGNCSVHQGASSGIQVAILNYCPQSNGLMHAVPGTCWQNCTATEGTTTIGSDFFEAGKQYWFLVDGCAGSSCEFQIVVAIGADFPSLENDTIDSEDLTGPSVVCPGQTLVVSLDKPIYASSYVWNNPFTGEFNTSEPDAFITIPSQTPAGSYTVCLLDANNPCEESLSKYGYTGDACFTFEVETIPDAELGPFQICLGDSYSVDGMTFSPPDTGVFISTYILTSALGCDSTVHLTLEVSLVNDEIIWTDSLLIATESDAEYQWFLCGNGGIPIDGATAQSFLPEVSGAYQVLITKDGCEVFSECFEVIILSNGLTLVSNSTFFYPNPANETIHFELNSNARIVLHTIQGGIVFDKEFSTGKQFMDVNVLNSGTYITKVYLQDRVIVQKIILQK